MNRAQRRAMKKSAEPGTLTPALAAQLSQWWEQAQTNQRSGQKAEAAAIYRRILQLSPTHVESLHQLGILEAAAKNHAKAVSLLQQALSLRPDFAPALYSLGAVLHQIGRPEESLDCYRKALQARPDHAETLNALGLAHAALGALDEALDAYKQAQKNDPRFYPAYLNCAAIYMIGERYGQAEENLRKATALRPQDLEIRMQLVEALAGQLKTDEGIRLLREIAHPAHLPSVALLAELLFQTNQFEEVVRLANTLLERQPHHGRALYLRGASLRRLDQVERGEADLAESRRQQVRPIQERDYLPYEVYLQLSRRCNLRCTMCGHAIWKENSGFMSQEVFDRTLSQCKANGIKNMTILAGQGEPFLHPQIFDFLEQAVAQGFKVSIVTNGTPFTPERINRLAGINLEAIQFSFAGFDKESYEAIYVGAKFDQVLGNLKLLDKTLKERRSKTVLHVKGVSDSNSQEFVGKTRTFLQSLGIHRISTVIPNNFAGTVPSGPLYEEHGIHSYRALDKHVRTVCGVLLRSVGVYFDGRVTACGCYDANGALFLGDLMQESLADLRKGKRWRGLLDAFVAGTVGATPLCGKCDDPFG